MEVRYQETPDLQSYHQFVFRNLALNVDCTYNVPKRYVNLQFLGFGGQGTVVTAQDLYQQDMDGSFRTVVIKKLQQPFCHPDVAKRSYREFVLLKSFEHRNIIRLINCFTPSQTIETFDELYLVMEYASRNLGAFIYDVPRVLLPHQIISSIIYQVLSAIKHLHDSGILHRDLKPANIAINQLGTVKLLDFGLARRDDECPKTQYVMTRWYRAPEVIFSNEYDGKVDIWSVGCIMAEMILGRVLFPAEQDQIDNIQTWKKITEVLGTPGEEFISRLPVYVGRYIRSQQAYPVKSMEELFEDSNFIEDPRNPYFTANCARDLVSKMLKIDPTQRCSVIEALQHPYLQFHFRPEHVNIPPTVNNYHPEVDKLESLQELKPLLFHEVKQYEAQNNIFQIVVVAGL